MHYIDEGEGEVIVLLHGNPTWSFYYRNLIKQLKSHFRVIAPDFIGCGLSDRAKDKHFRAEDRMQQVDDFLKQLKIKEFSLVMHDWGGPIGTMVALKNLPFVKRLVYLNTTLTEIDSLPKVIKTAAKPIIGKFFTQYTARFVRLLTDFGTCKKLPREIKDGYLYPYQNSATRTAIWDFVADIPFDSSHPTYTNLMTLAEKLPLLGKIPVKIIWGLKDICFHRQMLGKVSAHFPHAEVTELADAAHLVLEDQPEIANEEIEKFLMGQSAPKPVQNAETGKPLYDAFKKYALKQPDQKAVVATDNSLSGEIRYTYTSYAELDNLVNKFERGLHSLGIKPNDRVLFLFPVGADFLALTLAVIGRGAVPVFVDPGVGKEKLKACITSANPDIVIWVPQAHILRRLWKDVFKHVRLFILANDWLFWKKHTISFLKKYAAHPLASSGESSLSFIAFTSGATGAPKGVLYTNVMMKQQLEILKNTFGLVEGGIDMPLLPIFSLFNIGLGRTTVLPKMNPKRPLDLDPERIHKIANDLKIDSSFGSPTLWTKIAEYAKRTGSKFNDLTKIFIAGAPVWQNTLEIVQSVIPEGDVFTPYGATEALPVTLLSARERQNAKEEVKTLFGEQGILVGKPVAEIDLQIIKPVDGQIENYADTHELQPLCIGEVIVKGKHVSPEYLNRPEANKAAKIKDGESFWHRMGDMGYVDENGALYFCGRKAHIVNHRSRDLYSIPTERIFNDCPKVRRSALIEVKGIGAAIAIEPLPQYFPQTDNEKLAFRNELIELAKKDPITESLSHFYFHPSFPVDARHNAKIYRDQLGVWASEGAKLA